jgi:hypothetical protein
MRLTRRKWSDYLVPEPGAEHERLQLEHSVEKPQEAQRELELPAGDANV